MKTVQFSISTQFNCQKHFHFKLFKQLYVTIQLSVNTVLMSKNSSISNNSVKHKHAVKIKYGLIAKNVSISSNSVYSIHFSINMLLVLFRALSGATTPGQSGPESDGNEGVLRIPQSSSTAGTSPSDCLVSFPGHSLGGVLPLCRGAVNVFYSPSWLGKSFVL